MANFFIDRPIFAWVLANSVVSDSTLAIFSLPVEQYPDLAPPNVRITAKLSRRFRPNAGKHCYTGH